MRFPFRVFGQPQQPGILPEPGTESRLSIPMNPIARSGVFDHRESEAA